MEPRRRTCHVCIADMSVRLQDDDGAPKPGVGRRVRVGRKPPFEPGRPPVDLVELKDTQENASWAGWRDHAGVTKEAGELGGAFGPHRLIRVWAGRGATQNTALLRVAAGRAWRPVPRRREHLGGWRISHCAMTANSKAQIALKNPADRKVDPAPSPWLASLGTGLATGLAILVFGAVWFVFLRGLTALGRMLMVWHFYI